MLKSLLARSSLEGLSKHEKLNLIVDREDTGTSDTAEDIGTSTLEERPNTFNGNNLAGSVQGRLVLHSLQVFVRYLGLAIRVFWELTSPEVIIIRRRIVSSG